MALYVYGLMRAADAARACSQASEAVAAHAPEPGAEVRAVDHEALSALVSDVPDGSLQLTRHALLAHSDALQAAFASGPVLPMRFGTVVPDNAALERDVLGRGREALLEELESLDGKAELQVKAEYLEEPLLRGVLAGDRRMRETAARLQRLPPGAAHLDRIALGEAVTLAVQARRDRDAQELVDELQELALAITLREPSHERAVLNASFLVEEGMVDAFDSAVARLSDEHAQEMRFKLIGPMPAYSFVQGSESGQGGPWA